MFKRNQSSVLNHRKKNRKKVLKTIIQTAVIVVAGMLPLSALVDIKKYNEPDKTQWENQDGFIALSYFGVDRNGTPKRIAKKELDKQLKALHDQGYETISQQDVIDFYGKGKALPEKALFLSFEDGRNDSSIFAHPSLKEYNYKATFLSYANKMGNSDRKFLQPEDMLDMQKGGYWELGTIMEASIKDEVDVDLTVVNDRFTEDGLAVQKDSMLITRLMATPESRRAHIDDIVDTVSTYNFEGVEIDYEKVKDEDWDNVCAFYEELYQRLQQGGKPLRIVLGPRMPIEKLTLPEGPTYIMMAYNLYGTHSGPGPKADYAFIAKMGKKMDQLPGEHVMAFATGGFDWPESGKITALTEQEAAQLSMQSVKSPKRDQGSGAVYFDYIDSENRKHTVRYADARTLAQWMESEKKAGYYKIALWRMGGFEQATLDFLNR